MTHAPPQGRPLSVLRATIDGIDRDILLLLARRMAVVGEIADYKREQRIGIRDLGREREVLKARRERGQQLGLPGGLIDSVYRLVLLASRDRQAALRVEVPKTVEAKTVAIIGGSGGMGRCMAGLFADLGHTVLVSDLETELGSVDAAKAADVVVISVPISVTEEVIRQVAPHVRTDALLMDVTSVKQRPMQVMMDSTSASVVGTHPMFGPGVNTLAGQRVVVCPGRGATWHDWIGRTFRARGLVVSETSAAEHDRAMAVVQVLNHFQTQVLGLTLSRLKVPFEQTLRFTSPAYLLEAYVTARHFAQSPQLYGPIEMLNPLTGEVTDAFKQAAEELSSVIARHDQARFKELFEGVRGFFGEFTEVALEQSKFLIDRLVELSAGRDADVDPSSADGPEVQ